MRHILRVLVPIESMVGSKSREATSASIQLVQETDSTSFDSASKWRNQ